MARPGRSLLRRVLVQADCAFWCVHDHLDVLAPLALPTLAALVATALLLVGMLRTWHLSAPLNVLLAMVLLPFLALCIFTVLPLPCAVFAWRTASGETATPRECVALCLRRAGRLLKVLVPLSFLWLGSLVLLGLPLLWLWPRTCLTPLVALFEDDKRIFRRSRRILREDLAVPLIGLLYLGMGLVLGGLVVLPRLLFGTSMLGAHLVEEQWRPMIVDNLWIFETLSVAVLLTAIAVSWWISLTFIYHDIRWVREGEGLRRRIARLRASLAT